MHIRIFLYSWFMTWFPPIESVGFPRLPGLPGDCPGRICLKGSSWTTRSSRFRARGATVRTWEAMWKSQAEGRVCSW